MKNIFVKSHINNESINTNVVMSSIPENYYNAEQPDLKKNNTEWRWRIFNIKGKKYIEISYQDVNSERLYYDREQFVSLYIDPSLDKYIEKEYYCYAN